MHSKSDSSLNRSLNHHPHSAYKICKVCGLSFSNRAKWSKRNQVVLYCSQRCRRNKPSKIDQTRQNQILEFLIRNTKRVPLDELLIQAGFPATDQGIRKGKWAVHRLYHTNQLILWKEGRQIHPDQNKGQVFVEYATEKNMMRRVL